MSRRLICLTRLVCLITICLNASLAVAEKPFMPGEFTEEEQKLWEAARKNPLELVPLAIWLREYALGDILLEFLAMQTLIDKARKAEYLHGNELTAFIQSRNRLQQLLGRYETEIEGLLTLKNATLNWDSGRKYVLLRSLNIGSADYFAHLEGKRHLVTELRLDLKQVADPKSLTGILRHDYMRQVDTLVIYLPQAAPDFDQNALLAELIAAQQNLTGIRNITFLGVRPGLELGKLGNSQLGGQLESLALWALPTREFYSFDEAVQKISGQGRFKQLKALALRSGLGSIQASISLAGLSHLKDASFKLSRLSLPVIVRKSGEGTAFVDPSVGSFKDLRELTVDLSILTGDGDAFQLFLDGLLHLDTLNIEGLRVNEVFWQSLVESKAYQRIRSLKARRTGMRDSALKLLIGKPSESLQYLDVSGNPITREGCASLSRAQLPNLRTLALSLVGDGPSGKGQVNYFYTGTGLPSLQILIDPMPTQAIEPQGQSLMPADRLAKLLPLFAQLQLLLDTSGGRLVPLESLQSALVDEPFLGTRVPRGGVGYSCGGSFKPSDGGE